MVYFIQQGDGGPIKIGYTSGLAENRLLALQTANPYPLRLLGSIRNAGKKKESELHKLFEYSRLSGEWFEYSRELDFYIRSATNPFDYEKSGGTHILLRWVDDYNTPEDGVRATDRCLFCGDFCPGSLGQNNSRNCAVRFHEITHEDGTGIVSLNGFYMKRRDEHFHTQEEIKKHKEFCEFRSAWIEGQLEGMTFDYYPITPESQSLRMRAA